MEGNLKALESLAMVGLVPRVMAVLEARSMWEEDGEEGLVRVGAGASRRLSEASDDEAAVTDVLRRRSSSSSGSGGGGPTVRGGFQE